MKKMARHPKTILIMAGGTGGHIFPALAVAKALQAEGWTVSWLGTRRGLESRVVPERGIPIDYITIEGIRGRRKVDWLLAPVNILRAAWQAWRILLQRKPAVVLGMGGFASGPGGLAAWLGNFPLIVHEQNSIPGMTNRFLAKLADQVCISFPNALAGPHVHLTGNPVRAELCAVPAPDERYATRTLPLRVLVLGGSLGAQALNNVMPAFMKSLTPEERPLVRHQSGEKHFQDTKRLYDEAGISVEIMPFIEDMAQAYLWADLVICRAGAMTVAELTVVGLPAILIPYPHAVDDHQTHNAQLMVNAGAAVLIPQTELTVESLRRAMDKMGTLTKCLDAANHSRSVAKPTATQAVAALCQELGQ